ncbi:sigma-70 family RNA polymerase sigma factor [Actinoplanes sp. NPDC048796]|uniref:RNA polymerase sigma factor n=1 Tax=Actinoplanes sp. NPDC048796 TaxID=3155640 RepID=UPI0033F3BE87
MRAGEKLSDDRDELAILYERDYARLVRFAALMVGSVGDAEEIVQDAFVAAYRSLWRIRDQDRLGAYVMRSVINGCRGSLRRKRHGRHQVISEGVAGPDQSLSSVAVRRDMVAVLAKLPQRQREVMFLRYYLDQSEERIARAMGITRGAVKTHAARAAGNLRSLLEREK